MSEEKKSKIIKKQTSRKGKKSWIKNIDLDDVDHGLEQVRLEERLIKGGKVHEQSDDQLFSIDRKGDTKIRKSLKFKKLRIDEILTPQSAVSSSHLHPSKRPSTIVTEKLPNGKPKLASKHVSQKIARIAESLAKGNHLRKEEGSGAAAGKRKRGASTLHDPWADHEEEAEDAHVKDKAAQFEYLDHLRARPVKKPKLPDQRPAKVPAVKVADAGASYNPTFEDHQGILQKALDVELEAERVKEKVKKQLSYPPELDELDDEDFFDSDAEEEEEQDANDQGEPVKVSKAVTGIRKTKAQRNKEKTRAELERKEAQKKLESQLGKQIKRLPEIMKTIDKKAPASSNQKKQKELPLEKRVLGPHRFKALPIDFKLTEELTDSLRKLKPEGNLFKDRFASLQERTIVETRVPVTKKLKYKRKETERHDYKRFV